MPEAATDAKVMLDVCGSLVNYSFELKTSQNEVPFQAGQKDIFTFLRPWLGEVTEIGITYGAYSPVTKSATDWFVSTVVISTKSKDNPGCWMFAPCCWLGISHNKGNLTQEFRPVAELRTYFVTVITGTVRNASMSGKAFVVLEGLDASKVSRPTLISIDQMHACLAGCYPACSHCC